MFAIIDCQAALENRSGLHLQGMPNLSENCIHKLSFLSGLVLTLITFIWPPVSYD